VLLVLQANHIEKTTRKTSYLCSFEFVAIF